MKKALMVTSVASMISQFNIPNIKKLQNLGYEVTVATNFSSPGNIPIKDANKLATNLENNGVKILNLNMRRSPLSSENIKVVRQLRDNISQNNYDLIHCQSPVGGVLTRLAAKRARKEGTKVIYTAHGFHFYDGAPKKNWLLFYPWEKLLSRWTDVLITINQEDYKRANNKFYAKEVKLINGVGIDLNKFNQKRDSYFLRKELNLSSEEIILLSVGELNDNKNHQIIIKALAKLNNRKIHYVIAGEGDNKTHLVNLAKELGIPYQLHLLGFRDDISQIYPQVDMFIFPSQREGLSASLMEAMASGLPIICSNIRGNTDLIDHNEGGYLINQKNTDEYSKRINELYQEKSLRDSFGKYNQEKIKDYSIENVLESMCNIYSDY